MLMDSGYDSYQQVDLDAQAAAATLISWWSCSLTAC